MEFSEIIEHCKKDDRVAQGIVFNTYYRPMYHVAMRILANHHDTEDVLVLSFTRIFKSIGSFEYRGMPSLQKWVKTIVINEAIRLVSARNQLRYSDDMAVYETYVEESDLENVDTDEILSIIETMPAGYRVVFNLFAIEGYSHKEISELLSVSENTSKSQLRKARIYIIEKMKKKQKHGFTKY